MPPVFNEGCKRLRPVKRAGLGGKSKRPSITNYTQGEPVSLLNRDIGKGLPPVELQLVSHDASHVTQPIDSVR